MVSAVVEQVEAAAKRRYGLQLLSEIEFVDRHDR
jgi:hypothetical protein